MHYRTYSRISQVFLDNFLIKNREGRGIEVKNIACHSSCSGKMIYFLQIKPTSLDVDAIFRSFLSSPVLGSAYTRVGLYASTYGICFQGDL